MKANSEQIRNFDFDNICSPQVWLGQFKTSKIEALLEYNITSLPVITYGMMGGKRLLYKEPLDQFSEYY